MNKNENQGFSKLIATAFIVIAALIGGFAYNRADAGANLPTNVNSAIISEITDDNELLEENELLEDNEQLIENNNELLENHSETADDSDNNNAVDEVNQESDSDSDLNQQADVIDEFGVYTSKEDVALYIHTYGKLPNNFMTKKEAKALGWQGGGLDDFAEGYCIGGDYYGNYEGLLPEIHGRTYHECDIDTLHKQKRGKKRIIYSNDGNIYYTEDHYESFELLYGED